MRRDAIGARVYHFFFNKNLHLAETIDVQYPHLFDDRALARLSRS